MIIYSPLREEISQEKMNDYNVIQSPLGRSLAQGADS